MKREFLNRNLVYCLMFVFISMYGFFEQQDYSSLWFFIGSFGATSAIYLTTYAGLKLGRFRLREESNLRKWIEKIYIPGKEIIIHICIVAISIVVMSLVLPSTPIMQEKKIDQELLVRVERECGRTDINSVINVNGDYVVTFSDKSKKVIRFEED